MIKKDWNEAKNEWDNDLPKYDPDYTSKWKKSNKSVWDYWNYFRWILNAAFIGMPLSLVSVACLVLNIWTSVDWNYWWAYGLSLIHI